MALLSARSCGMNWRNYVSCFEGEDKAGKRLLNRYLIISGVCVCVCGWFLGTTACCTGTLCACVLGVLPSGHHDLMPACYGKSRFRFEPRFG